MSVRHRRCNSLNKRALFLTDRSLAATAFPPVQAEMNWRRTVWIESRQWGCVYSLHWAARAKWPRLQRETLGLFRTTETLMLGTWSLKISVSGQLPNVRQCDNKGKGTLKSDRLVLWPHSWAFFEPQISHWITILQSSCEDQRQCLFTYNVCALLKCVYSSIFPNIFCFLRAGTHFFFFFCLYSCKI